MIRPLFIALAVATGVIGACPLRSQAPAARQTPAEALRAVRTQNQKVIDQQTATLQKLEDLQKESQQLRIFARRS